MSEAPSTALVKERASLALGASKHEAKLVELVKESVEIVAITNPAGLQQCHAARMKLKRERVALEKEGKSARDDARKFVDAVIEEEKRLIGIIQTEETRLDTLQTAYEEKLEAERQAKLKAEEERKARILAEIEEIRAPMLDCVGKPAARIEQWIGVIASREIGENFGEFKDAAIAAKEQTLAKLRELHTSAVAFEAEQKRVAEERAELDRRRAEQEARDREDAARRKAEDEERARIASESKARIEQQERESRLRVEAQERAARERQEEQDRLARLKREADERARQEQLAREESERREREDADRAARQAEEDRLRAQREEQDRRQREIDARERQAREEQEAKASAEREAQEAEARRQQEARDAAEREERRKAMSLADGREALRLFLERHSHEPEFAAVCTAIEVYFAVAREREPAEAQA